MNTVMNLESIILSDIESYDCIRFALMRYSGIKIDSEVENNLISVYLNNRKNPEWVGLRKAIYYYAFYFTNANQCDYLIKVLKDAGDDGFKYIELDPMIESSVLTLLIYNFAAEAAVIAGTRSKLFKDVNRWIIQLSLNDVKKAAPFMKKIERFAVRFFKRFNSSDLEDVIKPILDNAFTR